LGRSHGIASRSAYGIGNMRLWPRLAIGCGLQGFFEAGVAQLGHAMSHPCK
jgi:hypothetical protein